MCIRDREYIYIYSIISPLRRRHDPFDRYHHHLIITTLAKSNSNSNSNSYLDSNSNSNSDSDSTVAVVVDWSYNNNCFRINNEWTILYNTSYILYDIVLLIL